MSLIYNKIQWKDPKYLLVPNYWWFYKRCRRAHVKISSKNAHLIPITAASQAMSSHKGTLGHTQIWG